MKSNGSLKKLLFVLFLIVGVNSVNAQTFQWVSLAAGSGGSVTESVATDASGNAYVVGTFDSSVTIGSALLTSAGASDIFIAKFNTSGGVIWAKRAGGSGVDEGKAICVDDSGNCYITGVFHDGAKFGSITLHTVTAGNSSAYVVKYSKSGAVKWADAIYDGTNGNAIACNSDRVAIAGSFYVYAIVGTDTLSDADTDAMLAVLNSHSGVELWGRRAGEYLIVESAYDVAFDGTGNIYYTGHFWYSSLFTSIFGSVVYPAQTITANASPDFFIAKYEPGGGLLNVLHTTAFSGAQGGYSEKCIKVDASGNLYYAGTFKDTLKLGSVVISSPVTAIGVVKFNSLSVATWGTVGGSTLAGTNNAVNGLAIDASGNSYITGWTIEPAYFGSKTVDEFSCGGGSSCSTLYAAKLNSSGSYEWVTDAGKGQVGLGIARDGNGNLFITGYGDDDPSFSHVNYDYNGQDGFITKLNADLHTGVVSASICAGNTISIPYTADVTFNAENIFTAQLSDDSGHFNLPVTLGTISATSSGTIGATIPFSTAPGSLYRIRVVGSSPSKIGSNNGTDIAIKSSPMATVTPPGPITVCKPNYPTLSVTTCGSCFYQWYKGGIPLTGATSTSCLATKTGLYSATVTNTDGCSAASATVSVTVNPTPAGTITPCCSTDICLSGSVLLSTTSGVGQTYQWKKDGANISGATTSTYLATAIGSYKVKVTNSFGCSKTSKNSMVYKSCRLNDVSNTEEEMFLIFPNPSSGNFTLRVNDEKLKVRKVHIEVINLLGEKVFELDKAEGTEGEISLPEKLSEGVYWLTAQTENWKSVNRMVVIR